MSLPILAALARAAAISGIALWLALGAARLVGSRRGRLQGFLWMLLIAPCLMPAFLTGYAWARAVLSLTMQPGWNEVIYAAALVVRLMPVAALVLYFMPSPLSAEGKHCHRLMGSALDPRFRATHTEASGCRGGKGSRALPPRLLHALRQWRFHLAGMGAGPWIAFGLVFLLSFGEFELAAMWSLKTWPVVLFDAQAGGLALKETLRMAVVPALLQALVLAALIGIAGFCQRSSATPATVRPGSRAATWATIIYLVPVAGAGALCPLLLLFKEAMPGFAALRGNALLARDIGTSVFFATGAALLAWNLSRNAGASLRLGKPRMAWLLGAPGLLGGLVLALLVLAGFQLPILRGGYDTPLPLLLTLTLVLLPLALVLQWLCGATRPAPALHLARMLKSRPLLWQLEHRRRWWSLFLLFCWGYFEFSASSILAPIGMTPVIARLHNLAHYGQTAVLSAMICAAVAVPLSVLLLTSTARGLYARIRGHSSHLETRSRLPGARTAARPLT